MRKSLLFVFSCLLIIGSYAQEKNPDTLIQKALNALKAQDEAAYLALYPDYRTYESFYKDIIENNKDTASWKLEGLDLSDSTWYKTIREKISRSFRKQLEDLKENQLNPGDLVFTDAKYLTTGLTNVFGPAIKTIHGTMYLKNKTSEIELRFGEMLWIEKEQAWFGINFKGVRVMENNNIPDSVNAAPANGLGCGEPVTPPVPRKPKIKRPEKSAAKKPN